MPPKLRSEPILTARDIGKSFGGLTAVADFTVELMENEIAGLIGPNGAGKTTVFNLLTGVYKPDVGSIELRGKNLLPLSPDRVTASGMARTFQNIRLFKEMTVLENVKVGFQTHVKSGLFTSVIRGPKFRSEEKAIDAQARELLELFGLGEDAENPSRNLPYGKQRKLEIARALATRPRVLLLDEPAAGMNESESAALKDLLLQIREQFKLSLLVIEHHMPFVMGLVSRLMVLDHGVTIAQGTPLEIRGNQAVIEAYLGKDHA